MAQCAFQIPDMKEIMTAAEYREYIKNPGKRKSKYNAQKTEADGITFDSKKEAKRYKELMLLHKSGEISKPILQYEFLLPGGVKYRCDFLYFDYFSKAFIVEDAKGVRTDVFMIKAKQMKDIYNIKIKET